VVEYKPEKLAVVVRFHLSPIRLKSKKKWFFLLFMRIKIMVIIPMLFKLRFGCLFYFFFNISQFLNTFISTFSSIQITTEAVVLIEFYRHFEISNSRPRIEFHKFNKFIFEFINFIQFTYFTF
jgi:hypothetical protein